MKYLINREQFLKESKFTGLQTYEKTPYSGEEFQIYESDGYATNHGAGPFHNDIGWNDSLLGRFINHLVRKAKIMIGKMQIKGLTRRLKSTFDEILASGKMMEMSEENKSSTAKVILYTFFWELVQSVDNGEKVLILRKLTNDAILNLEKCSDFDEKSVLLKELEDFLKFLEQFKDDDGESEVEGESEESEVSESKGVYFQMVKNLKSLSLILLNYKKVDLNTNISTKTYKDSSDKRVYITKVGDTVQKIQQNTKVNIKNLDTKTIRVKNKQLSKYPRDMDLIEVGTELVLENNNNLFENTIGTGAGVDRGNVKDVEDHLTQAFTKLKRDIEVLISPKEKGIGVDFNSLNELVKNSNDTKNKEYIKLLYSDIKRYLVGDKKSTLQEKDPLFKENLNISIPKERVVIAEKIARFSKRALQFKGTNLEGGLGDLKTPLLEFIKSLDIILKSEVKTEVKESLFNYSVFISRLNEADESTDDESETTQSGKAGELSTGSISEKIKDYFDKNCKGVRAFTIDKTEALKISENLENTKTDKFVIDGFDPIIEIVRIYNRAYKIYMTLIISKRSEKITGGTSGPSAGTLMEYTPMGSGGNGPYRNNKIFNIWEDSIFDILGNRDYQVIFDKKTMLRVGDELRPEKGSSLRKFMTDLLDGDALYGPNASSEESKGAQAKLLNKYFGDDKGEIKPGSFEVPGDPNATKEGSDIQGDVQKAQKKLKFVNSKTLKVMGNTGSIFILSVTDKDGVNKQYTFFCTEKDNGSFGLVYSRSFGSFADLLTTSIGSNKVDKGDCVNLVDNKSQINGNKFTNFYTKLKSDNISEYLKSGKKIKIGYTEGDDFGVAKEEELTITNIYWLTKEEEDKKQSIFRISEPSDLERAKAWFNRQGKQWKIVNKIPNSAKIQNI